MRQGKIDANRQYAMFLVSEALSKKLWIRKWKYWYTPQDIQSAIDSDPEFGIDPERDSYSLDDPWKAIESAERSLKRLKSERELFLKRISEYQERGR